MSGHKKYAVQCGPDSNGSREGPLVDFYKQVYIQITDTMAQWRIQ